MPALRIRSTAAVAALTCLIVSPAEAAPSPRGVEAAARPDVRVIGESAQGRPIRVLRVGSARARTRVLVVGAIHGDELAGRAVVRRLRHAHPGRGVSLWLIDTINPDGTAARTRQNARGVDLNRNFGFRWRRIGRPFSETHSGRRPLSEPESRAAARFVRRLRPDVSLWYHQPWFAVEQGVADPELERLYSKLSGVPRWTFPRLPGTATRWQNHAFPSDSAMTIELGSGNLTARNARRHAETVLALGRAVANRAP